MRVAATLHVCGGNLGSTGMQQKFEFKMKTQLKILKFLKTLVLTKAYS